MTLGTLALALIVLLIVFPIFKQPDPQTQNVIWVLIVLLLVLMVYDGVDLGPHHLWRRTL